MLAGVPKQQGTRGFRELHEKTAKQQGTEATRNEKKTSSANQHGIEAGGRVFTKGLVCKNTVPMYGLGPVLAVHKM